MTASERKERALHERMISLLRRMEEVRVTIVTLSSMHRAISKIEDKKEDAGALDSASKRERDIKTLAASTMKPKNFSRI